MTRSPIIFVIGASSGGFRAVSRMMSHIPKGLNASYLIVLHSAYNTNNALSSLLAQHTDLDVCDAEHGMEIKPDTAYIAKVNHHLFVRDSKLFLSKGPRENLFRPAIDVLFRSAAVAFQNRCVGILLTGRLNDGTNGLECIQKCGGTTIIENPETAEFSSMPLYAKESMEIDYIVNIQGIPQLIKTLSARDLPPQSPVPAHIRRENEIAIKIKSQIGLQEDLGTEVPISCASCGGPLWEMKDSNPKRYRCHVGHAFSQEALLKQQESSVEEALWVSVRTLEERRNLMTSMARDYEKKGMKQLVKSYDHKIEEISEHIKSIKSVLQLNV